MEKAKIDQLWSVFLEKYEKDFKEYMKYGKDEIEAIGVDIFFESMGWEKESQLSSYLTDTLHIMPCIDCGKKFGIVERDFGLCDECKEKYDLVQFEKYRAIVAADEGATTGILLTQCFMLSKEFRTSFAFGDDTAPMYAIWGIPVNGVDEKDWCWTPIALEELKAEFSGPVKGNKVFKIVLKNLSIYEQDGQDKFFAYENINWDKLYKETK